MSEPKQTLPERIEALVWSLENRMGTHDDVLELDAIKLEIERLAAERDDLKRVLSVDPDEWRRARTKADHVLALEAKCERLEEKIRDISSLEVGYKALVKHLDAAELREKRLEAKCERLERDVRWLLEGADDYWRTLPENAERFHVLCGEMLEGREP